VSTIAMAAPGLYAVEIGSVGVALLTLLIKVHGNVPHSCVVHGG